MLRLGNVHGLTVRRHGWASVTLTNCNNYDTQCTQVVMTLDRPDDDYTRPEGQVPAGGRGGDVPVARSDTVEPRGREEYYEVLRAADGRSSEVADSHPDRSGWDSVDAADRPPEEGMRVSPERRTHILDGDETGGGGHRHGVGKPGKTEFPASWDDEKIIANVLDVARRPDKPPTHQDWNDTWLCTGIRDAVGVWAVVERRGDILTGWPEEGGPGVVRNPKRGKS
jgi:Bacterial EndoU nuclease